MHIDVEPHRDRPTRFLGLWEPDGWRLKVWEVAYGRDRARPELIEKAKRLARGVLPSPAVTDRRYGVGFLGVHDGRGGAFSWVDWWAEENELHHHLWAARGDNLDLQYATPSGLLACVHELRVIVAERQAWIDTVLANPSGPDLEAYLRRTTA